MKTEIELKKLELGDDPLKNPDDDCLDRAVFAERIFKIIEGTPVAANMVIGIHGSWGTGKTTAMNFLRRYCEDAGHPVAAYNPWQFNNRQDAWQGFVSCIDKGMAKYQGKAIGSLKRKNALKKVSKKVREITAVTSIGKLAGSLILAPLEGLLEQTKQKVQDELYKVLKKKDKRLFVFIDDLDRAEPDILYDLLMLLNEIVNFKRCVYVIGLDVNVASQVITKKIGISDGKEFLDKIINWPFDLSAPTGFDWSELLEKELEKLDDNVKKEALLSIFPQLPRNPRKFKHFLRYINGLHKSFLSRFDDDELNWKILYLAQLLRIEFPNEFEKIMIREDVLDDLSSGLDNDRVFPCDSKEESNSPEWMQKVKKISQDLSDTKKERLKVLYKGLRDACGFVTPEQLKSHFLVIENPELFTWKEYRALKKKLLSSTDQKILDELKNFTGRSNKKKDIQSIREFLKMLIRDRENLLNENSGLSDEEEAIRGIKKDVEPVMKICSLVLDLDGIFTGRNPLFNKDVFLEWYENIIKWSHFKRRDKKKHVYSNIRELEKKLTIKLAPKLVPQASIILESLQLKYAPFFRPDIIEQMKAFKETHEKVLEILNKGLSDQLIVRFEKIDGIKDIWGEDKYLAEKRLLFYKSSLFHNKNFYKQLKEISQKASNNPEIQKNFLEYIRMLFYASTEHVGWVKQEEARKLLNEKEFMDIVWKAVVSRRIYRRTVGSLEKERVKIKKDILKDDKAFPVPKWWDDLISDVRDKISSG